MSFFWRKLGRLYVPSSPGRHPKLLSHAANPLPMHLEGDVFRVFFSGRDNESRSSVGAVDIDIVRRTVVKEHIQPFFMHGADNSFYADGISIGSCYAVNGVTYMLFMGWQNPKDEHWRGTIGRLIVSPDLTLLPDADAPFISLNSHDPISLSYPWVLRSVEGYSMWYGSTTTWDAGNGEMIHTINFASSSDGQSWVREGIAVPYEVGVAQAFSRPAVLPTRKGDGYDMWFSYRSGGGEAYRIGYATSSDGREWQLALGAAGIDVSADGWDSEMIEYPFVFDHEGERYLLYNGNGYGKTGFGLAVLEQA